jgi:predicted membrane metal-binding protein
MWRCDAPTRMVLAALAVLVSAALGHPLLALLAALAGRPRLLLGAVAVAAALFGGMRVAALQHRSLRSGPLNTVLVVTGAPSGDRAVVRVPAAGEDALLTAPGYRPQLGGVYRVSGSLRPVDPQVRDYYASQGVHLQLRASRLARVGRRGGPWGVVDLAHAAALRRLGEGQDVSRQRALVAGITLGETGSMPADVRRQFRDSGLYHLVSVVEYVLCYSTPHGRMFPAGEGFREADRVCARVARRGEERRRLHQPHSTAGKHRTVVPAGGARRRLL